MPRPDAARTPVALYHFSEDPGIARFDPHIARTSLTQDRAFVWAIDEWHAPMYYVPRDCPRACFWAGDGTSAEDRERWFAFVPARFVMAIESDWLPRLRSTRLYRYAMPEASFLPKDAIAGHFVSEESVVPLDVEPVGDLLQAIADAGVELRITPRLAPMWRRVWRSTLCYSGTRLRYAKGHPEEFE
jgi:hypothetical protein